MEYIKMTIQCSCQLKLEQYVGIELYDPHQLVSDLDNLHTTLLMDTVTQRIVNAVLLA